MFFDMPNIVRYTPPWSATIHVCFGGLQWRTTVDCSGFFMGQTDLTKSAELRWILMDCGRRWWTKMEFSSPPQYYQRVTQTRY